MRAPQSRQASERVEVAGIVQGVGFRPFVYRLATELDLVGQVGNDSAKVFIDVVGDAAALDEFAERLRSDAPPLSFIEHVTRRPTETTLETDHFRIVDSVEAAGPRTLVPPDTGLCPDCLAELFESSNRRFRHPFITCTNCGPRFSIITSLPYDRPNTTMADFAMCAACTAEYTDPTDRRYHAQPIGCHECGPTLWFSAPDGEHVVGRAGIEAARKMICSGHIVAVKGVGGFHFAVDATDEEGVGRLRHRKHRPDKPLAVMVRDLEAAQRVAVLSSAEERLLTSPARPVVLARARGDAGIVASVAPGNPLIGVMLAYTPVHHLLLTEPFPPVVMTSANVAGEPITYRDADIEAQLGTVADGLLTNDRRIATPCDDSVVRVVDGSLLPIRRGRGYAPIPVSLERAGHAALGVGGELKSTCCVTDGVHAWVSPHIGDMGTLATLRTFEETVDRFQSMYGIEPAAVAVDSHPGYATSRWAHRTWSARVVETQHHHAHIAAVMAEHHLDPATPVLGFAFDGTGYGDDGSIWGGEVLHATATGYERLASLVPVALPGGDAAIEHPARVALAHLTAAEVDWDEDLPAVGAVPLRDRRLLAQQLASGFGCVPTTSMGRLFDAVASLIGLRHRVSFEAQAAIELEHAAQDNAGQACDYRFELGNGQLDQRPVIRAIVADLLGGRSPGEIADGFHTAVSDAVRMIATRHAASSGIVVLSGGVFQNALLTERTVVALRESGHDARTHRLVPPNDGGLALGQAFIATNSPIPQET